MKRPLIAAGFLCLALSPLVIAANPGWWTEPSTQVIDLTASHAVSENYAPANLGQLKNMAKKAKLHLDTYAPGKAGATINSMVSGFGLQSSTVDNYAPINLGQLKAVAKPFYDRLSADLGYDTRGNLIARGYPSDWWSIYPWDPTTPVGENYAPANIGQLKMAFSFDLSGPTGQIPTWWLDYYFPDESGVLPGDDADQDGLTNLQEFQQNGNPNDYYSQGSTTIIPVLTIVGGNFQASTPGQFLTRPLKIEVRNGVGGPVLSNAPVAFSITSGTGGLAAISGDPTEESLTVRTDSAGIATVYYQTGETAGTVETAQAQAGATIATYKAAFLANGLVGRWRFNEGTGLVIADSGALGNNGALVSQGASFVTGVEGTGLSFAGLGQDDATLASGANSEFLGFGDRSFSVSLWFKSDATTASRLIGNGSWGATKGYSLALGSNSLNQFGRLILTISSKTGNLPLSTYPNTLLLTTKNAFNNNQWHHVVTVVDREGGTVKLYVDGVAQEFDSASSGGTGLALTTGVASADISAMTNLDAAAGELLRFGQYQKTGNPFKGQMDDVRIYARALSAPEAVVAAIDFDDNGMGDAWEVTNFGAIGVDPKADPDQDGLTNLQEYQQVSNPNNYYSQGSTTIVPTVSILSGNNQTGAAGAYLPLAFRVEVKDSVSGDTLPNAPVVFALATGSTGGLSEETGSSPTASSITVRTDSYGMGSAFFKQGFAYPATNTVTATAAVAPSVTFTSSTSVGDGLYGHWKFDEMSGTVADDATVMSHDGTLTNSPQWSARFTGEGAINLTGGTGEGGSNSYVTMGNPSDGTLDFGSDSFTIALWVKYSAVNTLSGHFGRRIISKGHHGFSPGYTICLGGTGHLWAGIGATNSTQADSLFFRTANEYNDNQWHHVAVVFNRTASTAQIYVDGLARNLFKESTSGGTINPSTPNLLTYSGLANLSATRSDVALTVGSHLGTYDFFKGGIDDVRLYRKALTAAEIQAIQQNEGVLTALTQSVTVDEDTKGVFTPKSVGGGIGAATYQILTAPTNGEAVVNGEAIEYYPNAHYNGADTLHYRVTKGGYTSEADLNITVNPINDPPLVSVGGAQSVTLPNTLSLTSEVEDIDTLAANISVTWTKVEGPGTVTFGTPTSLTTTAAFSVAGQYTLRMAANDGQFTRGDSLIVTVNPSGTASLPSISLVAPANNATKAFAQAFSLEASATVPAGQTVSKVEFYEGSRKIGEDTTPNSTSGLYELSWTPPRLGAYALSAIVTASGGAKLASNPSQVVVSQDGWFGGGVYKPGNEGYTGSGGRGGLSFGSAAGPTSSTNQTGQNGGGSSAGGGGNGSGGAKNDVTLDSDGDGLTDAEEKELGSDPNAPHSDNDGLVDGEDADPNDSIINWRRAPDTKFAMISVGRGSAVTLTVGNNGELLKRSGNGLWCWKNGKWFPLDLGTRSIISLVNRQACITDSGAIYVNAISKKSGEIEGLHALMWSSPESAAVSLSDVPESRYESLDDYSTNSSAVAVSRSGLVFLWKVRDEKYPYSFGGIDRKYKASWALPGAVKTYEETSYYNGGSSVVVGERYNSDVRITSSGHAYLGKLEGSIPRQILFLNGGGSEIDMSVFGGVSFSVSESPAGEPVAANDVTRVYRSGAWLNLRGNPGVLNGLGEGLRSGSEFWRNGKIHNLGDLCSGFTGSNITPRGLNDQGMICADIVTNGESVPFLLVPVDIAVDANRDGVVKFAGNNNDLEISNKIRDVTDKDKPFRFWINDDDDGDSGLGQDEIETGRKDFADGVIKTTRDLEDFTRLHLYVGVLQDAIAAGDITVGLEWRDTDNTNPSINIYQAEELNGGEQYLVTSTGAISQTLGSFSKRIGGISAGGSYRFPASFWKADAKSGRLALSKENPSRYLIFEGVAEGKGRLVMTFYMKGDKKPVGEGGDLWLDIKQIKKMYQRWDSASGSGSHPWGGDEYVPPSGEQKEDAIVFVHGWRMSPGGAGNFAETMYKRLWHRGFNGRFIAFHWDTWWHDGWQWVNDMGINIGAALAHFNDSEYTAWNSAGVLKNYVDNLPFKNKNIIAHSMGNIVVGEALREGMVVKNYSMLNAAVPAACYDEDEGRVRQGASYSYYGLNMWDCSSPDGDADPVTRSLAYRGTFKAINSNARLVNFFLPRDVATSFAWEINNDQTKPPKDADNGKLVTNFGYDSTALPGLKLWKYAVLSPTVPTYYLSYPNHKFEAMAHACRSWGKAVGAWGGTQGAVGSAINLGTSVYDIPGESSGFGDEHSAEFNANIQYLRPFYNRLMDELRLRRIQ